MIDRTCVIGAGSSGLAAIKNLREYGFDVDCFEAADDLGGNWNFGKPTSRVYRSTHMISSKPFTQYPDFPMPDAYPDYPHHRQLLEYFRAYARHFGLYEHIRFRTRVLRVEPYDGAWDVTVAGPDGEETRRYAAVVIANGHNWHPKYPEYPGEFTGEILHSAQYKGPEVLAGKRVVVVGAGNTGCDIAVESAQVAAETYHSTRRGYWYVQKYNFGRPGDQVMDLMLALRLPLRLRRALYKATARLTVGDVTRFGLPKPDHEPFETHPIINTLLPYYVGQGDIVPKPDIARFAGEKVVFADGSQVTADLVLYATGYLARFEFLDEKHLNWTDGRPRLYQHVFTPHHDNLFVAGLIQPDSGQFTLVHWQTVAIAEFLTARRERPELAGRFLAYARQHVTDVFSGGTRYKDSTRHYYEVAHQDYLRGLERTINRLRGAR
ncbi:monooxygenase [Carbonactinospora thermoautotrophica]|uniref:Fad-dependent pyridine nucleotide-disulfide oxidoreductase n=1 Tax=Carbonactinospora thermoautotrophica TaxID=1469144 RepID=A0A132MN70_9ACTN|nr:NAD(P)-binding domain-containing protein [Carbonactinospora thermoautotrophica]KWW99298.1 Fad-dependent pyridine nucleotide-disulfide oxidoreductase [Carbonactinospora thermoautotrophica]MCX9192569.1 monooxygenase [Carbonactinospora thermoautotrophica]